MRVVCLSRQTDVCCMLFTDMLLVTKPVTKRGGGDKLKVIKAPMRLDKIVVHGLRDAGILISILTAPVSIPTISSFARESPT